MAPLVPRYNRLDCGLSEMSPSLPQRARTPELQPFPLQNSQFRGAEGGPWRVHDGTLLAARREALGRPRPPP